MRLMLWDDAERRTVSKDAGSWGGGGGVWVLGGKGGQWKVIAADWIVMPRARSAGRKSVTVEPSSTSVGC
jgi:hypothetical protein